MRLGGATLLVILGVLGGVLGAVPDSDAQAPGKVPRVGVLRPQAASDPNTQLLRRVLGESGLVEGQTVAFEWRWADGQYDRLAPLAAELVGLRVDAIVTFGEEAIRAVQQATGTIPLVGAAEDLAGAGLVASVARPGRNTTGVSIFAPELNAKRLQLLKESLPKVSRVASLWHPGSGTFHLAALEAAARSLSVTHEVLEVRGADGLPRAFEAARKSRVEALNVLASPFLTGLRRDIITLAAKDRLPTVYPLALGADDGGLMAYGPTLVEIFRLTAQQLDRILKGARPADLPVLQPTRFELVLNLRSAKVLGVTFPPSVLARADRIIE